MSKDDDHLTHSDISPFDYRESKWDWDPLFRACDLFFLYAELLADDVREMSKSPESQTPFEKKSRKEFNALPRRFASALRRAMQTMADGNGDIFADAMTFEIATCVPKSLLEQTNWPWSAVATRESASSHAQAGQ
jgi:hypothetical protein